VAVCISLINSKQVSSRQKAKNQKQGGKRKITAEGEGRRSVVAVLFRGIRTGRWGLADGPRFGASGEGEGGRVVHPHLLGIVGARRGRVAGLGEVHAVAKAEGRRPAQHALLGFVCSGGCKRVIEVGKLKVVGYVLLIYL